MKTNAMHTQVKRTTITLGTLFLLLIVSVNISLASAEKEENKEIKNSEELLIEEIESALSDDPVIKDLIDFSNETQKVSIYDIEENLIFHGELNQSENEEIIKLIHRSDLLMKMGNTSYYRLNK
ncbi:hypothetical protein QQ008_03760 [Fulvivirgaceae bacterium BMA10]|uniref:BON domain-containing protein n=1 Tax=Splendidivirga corallicola TaxID=3051826 RepID=A0ABT8KIA6_9BACT|nr:hypothetical protein [Fulvivirgaceae bacterium BMA10]